MTRLGGVWKQTPRPHPASVSESINEIMLSLLTKTYYNILCRFRPPEMVQYWKDGDKARARVVENETGEYGMDIEGEKYRYPGFPRGHVLTGSFARMKKGLKEFLLNKAFAEMERMYADSKEDMLPPEKMVPAVRHIWETFEKLENCEVNDDMRGRIGLIKKVFCQILQEDDAYRFRGQLFLYLIDQKKVKLSKADLYYARGKYWKPDRYKKLFGKIVDAYEY